MSALDINIDKNKLINAMPYVSIIILFVGLFIPIQSSDKLLLGIVFGAIGSVLIPYWREWKLSGETLKFSPAYLVPILISVMTAVVFVFEQQLYAWLIVETQGWPTWLAYTGGIVLGYGGKSLFNGFKNNIPFLELFRDDEVEIISSSGESKITLTPDGDVNLYIGTGQPTEINLDEIDSIGADETPKPPNDDLAPPDDLDIGEDGNPIV